MHGKLSVCRWRNAAQPGRAAGLNQSRVILELMFLFVKEEKWKRHPEGFLQRPWIFLTNLRDDFCSANRRNK